MVVAALKGPSERRQLNQDWLLSNWNECSWLHARIWGALVRAVPPAYSPMVDVKWSRSFRPDLCICDSEQVVGVVEYESTNSSNERLMEKDLVHFEEAIRGELAQGRTLPDWWLLISTLSSRPVNGWAFYRGYDAYPPREKSKAKRDRNPLAYYKAGVTTSFVQMCDRFEGGCKWEDANRNRLGEPR